MPDQSRQLHNIITILWLKYNILLLDCTVNCVPPPKTILTLEVTQIDISVRKPFGW